MKENLLIITGPDGRSQSDMLESGISVTALKNVSFNVMVIAVSN